MSSRWPDKYVEGGEWHKAWQKTLDGPFSVAAIQAFHAGDFRPWQAEMPDERRRALYEASRQILQIVAQQKRDEERRLRDARYAGSFWLDALLPSDLAEDLHANLEEQYPKWLERHGPSRARLIVNLQILRVLADRLSPYLGKLIDFSVQVGAKLL